MTLAEQHMVRAELIAEAADLTGELFDLDVAPMAS
jgi:hypothetical protein